MATLAILVVWQATAAAQQTLYAPPSDSHLAQVQAQAALVGRLAGNHRRNEELRAAREKGFLDTLYQVEKAAVPVPDDPPIRYPSAEKWRQVSARRPAGDAAEKRIEQALRSPTALDFVGVPLVDAIAYLKDRHGVEIQIDGYALAEAGITTSVPITRQLKGISLRSALRLILRDFDLTYVVQDEVILITSRQRSSNYLKTKVYPVGDLVRPRLRPIVAPRPTPSVFHARYEFSNGYVSESATVTMVR